ncbi:peptidylprolyl isomerase [Flagellimonas zhangzhouensis]|uniref:peptidylprolyl isomerase n=1 Tax=Flagellimonas zhangzhouensis TaxID=1073328 RepID=A0A1H2R6E9_9FLAO|nr:peptidylprolyl isomerase [Allomuricauda zhangzhouensis]SDQ59572.1 Peptidyl-prolyl cis-trans isomerase (rotamase)-cyclophilin family [Allomuricauda zhangzhouensis]SDW14249.1 Peptidyl-prolyl cis-trans isomerase (rotamase)-cyclophilin family [Allomuricauda zhangzhouensis]
MKKSLFLITAFTLVLLGCKSSKYADLGDGIFADIQTTKGDIIIKLEYKKTPVTVANFVSLAEGNNPFVNDEYKDKKFYDGIIFHRVIKDFMLQGGDPTGTGSGNIGYTFKDEFNDSLLHSKKGILSMANRGPKTNSSQFFITHKETPWLNGKHTVFGEVVSGMDVVDTIANVKTIARDKPEVDVVMNHVEIVRNGKEAKKFDAVQIMSDYFEEEKLVEAEFQKMKEDLVAEFTEQMAQAEETPSGLRILKLKEGEGEQPNIGQMALVNYAGWLFNGDLFDSNIEEIAAKFNQLNPGRRDQGGYTPFPMSYSPDAQLAAGFREGLLTMKIGDKIRIFVPPHLGYGDNDYGPIPGGSTLVFDLEIVGVQ